MNINTLHLAGNLTRDPEVRYTPKGTAVCNFDIASNRTYTSDNGEKQQETTFVSCVAWGRTAEVIGEYVQKGDPLYVQGHLKQESWDDKQTGQKRTKIVCVVDMMQLVSSRKRESEREEPSHRPSGGGYPKARRPSPPPPGRGTDPDDDEIPF